MKHVLTHLELPRHGPLVLLLSMRAEYVGLVTMYIRIMRFAEAQHQHPAILAFASCIAVCVQALETKPLGSLDTSVSLFDMSRKHGVPRGSSANVDPGSVLVACLKKGALKKEGEAVRIKSEPNDGGYKGDKDDNDDDTGRDKGAPTKTTQMMSTGSASLPSEAPLIRMTESKVRSVDDSRAVAPPKCVLQHFQTRQA